MAFRDELEPIVHPDLLLSPSPQRVPMQSLFDTVQARHPDAFIARAEIPERPDQAPEDHPLTVPLDTPVGPDTQPGPPPTEFPEERGG